MGLALAAICVLSAAAAVAVTFLARTRVVAQPVDVDVDAESDLLVACLAQPGLARALHTHPELQLDGASCLTAEAFTADPFLELLVEHRVPHAVDERIPRATGTA